jgi:hypothetical protein
MAWKEKGQSFSFEHQPLEGLFLLDGDVIAEEIGRDWTRGQKYPRLAFPSGLKFDIWEGRESPIIHLFGELDLALRSTRDEAFGHAFDIGEQCGYLAAPVGESQLEVIGWEDHLTGALESIQEAEQNPLELVARHVTGDWGELGEEDKRENELSVEAGYRILSAYILRSGVKVWVITEADRSVTTILLPSEY